MAKTTETPQSFADGLKGLLPVVAQCMAAPDADIRFCQALMVAISGKLKGGQPQGATAGVGGAPGGGPPDASTGIGGPPPGMGMPGCPAGGGAGNQTMPNLTGPTQAPGGAPGVGTPTVDPDELRRVISNNAAGG